MYIWEHNLKVLKTHAASLDDFFKNLLVDKMVVCCAELKVLADSDDHSLDNLKKIIRLEWNVNQLLYLHATGRNFATIPLDATQWYEDINHSPIDLGSFYRDIETLKNAEIEWVIITALEQKEGVVNIERLSMGN